MSNAHGKGINVDNQETEESVTSSSSRPRNAALASQPEFIRNLFMELEKDGVSKMECPVCLDPPDNGVLTPCGHLLCRECLFGSLQYFGGAKCPVCRAKVDMKTVVPINDTIDVTAAPTMDDLQSNGKTIRSAKLDAMIRILHSKLANCSSSGNVIKGLGPLDVVLIFVGMLKKVFQTHLERLANHLMTFVLTILHCIPRHAQKGCNI